MPPVGQNRICGNGPAKAFSALTPPTTSAGKRLAWVIPRSISATTSEAVAVPGRKGTSTACRPSSRVGVAPGETRKRAPAPSASAIWAVVVTVPAPTTAPSTSSAIRSIAASAASVRSVTSIAGRPPRTSASASGTASWTSSTTTTGITGASATISSMPMLTVPPPGCPKANGWSSGGRSPGASRVHPRALVLGEHRRALVRAADAAPERREQLAAGAVGGVLGDPGLAVVQVDVDLQAAALGVDAHDVPVTQARQRAGGARLGGAVQGGRPLAGRATHAAVGDERHAMSAVHQQAQRRRQLVQLGHPVRPRALVAHDRDDVAVEVAALERRQEVALVVEDARGRGHDAVLGRHG